MRGNIKSVVNKLINKYNTRNPFELCECLGIWTYEIPLGNTKGYYTYAQKKKVIFLNESLSIREKLIVCAHELGHALLHPKGNIYFKKNNTYYILEKYENTANVFAAELLISDEAISECPSYFNVNQIASSISMPIELLELKLK